MPLFWISLSFVVGLIIGTVKSIQTYWLLLPVVVSIFYLLIQLLPFLFINKFFLLSRFRVTEKIIFFPQKPTDPRPVFPRQLLFPSMLSMLCVGIFVLQSSFPKQSPDALAFYNDHPEKMKMIGVIDSLPKQNENSSTVFVKIEELCLIYDSCQTVSGRAYIVLNYAMDFEYGDQVEIFGKLSSPENYDSFSEISYLQSKQTFSKIAFPYMSKLESNHGNPVKQILYKLRGKGVNLLFNLYPQPEASLLAGILFGEEDQIPTEVETAFRNTSTSHIIVISGFNITILAAICLNVLKRFLNNWQSTIITLLILVGYTIMVGGDAAVSRAAVMGAMGLIGMLFGRKQTGINSLLFTAAALCVFNPFLIYDIGFQLSFIATAGLILFSDPIAKQLNNWFKNNEEKKVTKPWLTGLIYDYLSPLLAAQLMVTPLIVYYFHQLSLTSLPANLLIAPLQPPIMLLGALSVGIGFLIFPLGKLISFVAWVFTTLTIRIVTAFDALPFHSIHISQESISMSSVLIFYILLLAIFFGLKNKKISIQKLTPSFIAIGLVVIVFLVWQVNSTTADGLLHIQFLDISEGNAFLIQTSHGNQILINGGKSSVSLSNALYPNLPITQHQLDAIIVATSGAAHMESIYQFVQENQTPLVFWGIESESNKNIKTINSLAAQNVEVKFLIDNQSIQIDETTILNIKHFGNNGLSIILTYENLRMFMCLEDIRECQKILKQELSVPNVLYIEESFDNTTSYKLSESIFLIDQASPSIPQNNAVYLSQHEDFELISDGNDVWFEKNDP